MLGAFQGLFAKTKELAMCQTTRRIALFFCFTLSFAALSNLAQAQTETVLFDLGLFPLAGVTLDQQGRLYGTISYGGPNGTGEVYRVARAGQGWVFSSLYNFGRPGQGDGANPYSGVVFGPNGVLYGTTQNGGAYGYGTVFSLQPPATVCKAITCPWIETSLYSFTGGTDGAYPGYGNLAFDQAGDIYGTTYSSGNGEGVVFRLTRSGSGWAESVLWSGGNILTGVILDSAGNVYGGTLNLVFELSPTQSGWTETTLSDAVGGGLTFDGHGDLFGITGAGANGGDAVVYELTPGNGTWFLHVLQDFGLQYFAPVAPPTFDSQGNLYGPIPSYPSEGEGEIFKLTHTGVQWIYTPYFQFPGGSGGAGPTGAIVFDANGNMYGTTAGITTGGQYATVWEIAP